MVLDTQRTLGPVQVLLVDGNSIYATGCALTLARFGIEVVSEIAATAPDIMERYDELRPDVVMIDVGFGGKSGGGLELARQMMVDHPAVKIVILGQDEQDGIYRESYRIGACAFVTKDVDPADIAEAVARARAGCLYFLPHVAEHLASLKVRGDDCPYELLDGRELQVFKMMALGYTNQEIAESLSMSLKSISNYSMSVKQKLRTERIAELTRLAVRYRVIEP